LYQRKIAEISKITGKKIIPVINKVNISRILIKLM
jgi:hypothetical protein